MKLFNRFGGKKQIICSMDNSVMRSYYDYLKDFSTVVETVAHNQPYNEGTEAGVRIRSLGNDRCEIECSILEAMYLEKIQFEGAIDVRDDSLFFKTSNAGGFESPSIVQSTIIRYMESNLSDLQIKVIKTQIINKGDFVDKPLVLCDFSVFYKPNNWR